MKYSEAIAAKSKAQERREKRAVKSAENLEIASANGNVQKIVRIRTKSNRIGKRNKPKAKSRKWLVREADRVFSLYIKRKYPFSVFSGKPTEHCFHIFSRSNYATRWDEDNAVGSTAGENFEMEFNPGKYLLRLIEIKGLPFISALEAKHRTIVKFSNDDLREIIEKYRGNNG